MDRRRIERLTPARDADICSFEIEGRAESLTLPHGDDRFKLRLDRKACEMLVVGAMLKPVFRGSKVGPVSFNRTRPTP